MKEIFKNDDTYLARWLNGDLNPEELKEFEASEDFEIYKQISEKTSNLKTVVWDKDKLWDKIKLEGELSKPKKQLHKRIVNMKWIGYAAAASLILIIGLLALFRGDDLQTVQTFAAETKIVDLPDGSIAYLNAESVLRYDPGAFESNRELMLDGEAFFDVERGSKFTVETKNGDVRVLGTSFNVKSRINKLRVQCYSGRVGVSFNDFEDQLELARGDKVIAENNRLEQRLKVENDLARPEWRDGRSKFTNAKIQEVINELERQFDIEIIADNSIKSIEDYNGGFAHDNLESALDVVFSSVNYDFEINGKMVTLTKKN